MTTTPDDIEKLVDRLSKRTVTEPCPGHAFLTVTKPDPLCQEAATALSALSKDLADYKQAASVEARLRREFYDKSCDLEKRLTTIRAETIEACAKVADAAYDNSYKAQRPYDDGAGSLGYEDACNDIAAAIRASLPLPEQSLIQSGSLESGGSPERSAGEKVT